MSDLYYIAPDDHASLNDGIAVLTDAEARHLTRVMRKKVGDEADLFDGSGKEYRARIESIARDRVELTVLETREDDREPDLALTAIMALPKGDRQKWAIEKLTELGVRRFIPLDAELPGLVEILGAKLAGKSDGAATCSELGATIAERYAETKLFDEITPNSDVLRVVAHPISDGFFGQTSFTQLIHKRRAIPDAVLLLIGPVGGFADAEVQNAVDQGWAPLDLGKQVYRVETAAIVASALFLHLK